MHLSLVDGDKQVGAWQQRHEGGSVNFVWNDLVC